MKNQHRWFPAHSALWAMLAAAWTLGGCVAKSVSPVVTEKESEFDPGLVGSWRAEGDKETADISARGTDYLVLFRGDGDRPAHFAGRLGRLGDFRVLDLSPDESALKNSEVGDALVVPLHTFLVVDSIGEVLHARAVQPDSLKAYLERDPAAIAHMDVDGELVLTAPTPELRVFFERFLARPGVLQSANWARR